ncbi:ribonuclease H-like domain-containing protein, partial [Tanacetum coccineum]
CDNGTEFKNSEMNQFYDMKGIKREFSVARTPQQNGIAERKNKTLIEAARTMLADSLLPTTFWAEAINTACYVQNRVLITKPHNKTPYELLIGRSPNLDFMRPFGCPVTILNNFMRPFGCPVTILGIETNFVDDARKKNDAQYLAKDGDKNSHEKDVRDQEEATITNSTNRLSTVSPSVSAARQSFDNNDLPIDPCMPDLEDSTSIFRGAYNNEDVGAEADLNNLETTINVNHIPTTRIYKDHPKD